MKKDKNNNCLINYFNYKFNNLEGERIKLDFNEEAIYPKYTKKEILFRNNNENVENIMKYNNQNKDNLDRGTNNLVKDNINVLNNEDDFLLSPYGIIIYLNM